MKTKNIFSNMVLTVAILLGVSLGTASPAIAASNSSINQSMEINKMNNVASETENLIINGDFSKGFDGWELAGEKIEIAKFEHGNYAKMTIEGNYGALNQSVDIDPNATYRLLFLGYSTSTSGNSMLQIDKWTAAGGVSDVEIVPVNHDGLWKIYTTTINNHDEKYNKVKLQFISRYPGSFGITAVSLNKIG